MDGKKRITEYRNYYLPLSFPVILLSGEHWKISDVPSSRLHFHNCLEIGLCHTESGMMEFYDKEIPFKAGNVTLIPKNVLHTTYSTKGTESLWSYVFIDIEEMVRPMLSSAWNSFSMSPETLAKYNYIFDESTHPYICSLVRHIVRELEEEKTGYQLSVRGLVLALLVELIRTEGEITGQLENGLTALDGEKAVNNSLNIAPALEFIDANYMQEFPIDKLASICHLSATHFRRVFGEIMNCTPLDHLNNTRILKACSLLRSTEDSILTISERVGFRSVSSFNRSFIKVMNCTPRDYRKTILKNEQFSTSPSILKYNGWMQPEK